MGSSGANVVGRSSDFGAAMTEKTQADKNTTLAGSRPELEPVVSGYEEPLQSPVNPILCRENSEHDSRDLDERNKWFTPETRAKIAAKLREYHQRPEAQLKRYSKPQRKKRDPIPDDAEIVENENTGEQRYVWRDEHGRRHSRRVPGTGENKTRRKRARPRVGGSKSLKQIAKLGETLAERDGKDAERKTRDAVLAASYLEFYDLPPETAVKRGPLRNWKRVLACGGIPRDGTCPVCQDELDPKNRRRWVARYSKKGERRVVCLSCHRALGKIEKRPLANPRVQAELKKRDLLVVAQKLEKLRNSG